MNLTLLSKSSKIIFHGAKWNDLVHWHIVPITLYWAGHKSSFGFFCKMSWKNPIELLWPTQYLRSTTSFSNYLSRFSFQVPTDRKGLDRSPQCPIPLAFHLSTHCSPAQSCLTLCSPVNCSPPGSSVHGILQARILD